MYPDKVKLFCPLSISSYRVTILITTIYHILWFNFTSAPSCLINSIMSRFNITDVLFTYWWLMLLFNKLNNLENTVTINLNFIIENLICNTENGLDFSIKTLSYCNNLRLWSRIINQNKIIYCYFMVINWHYWVKKVDIVYYVEKHIGSIVCSRAYSNLCLLLGFSSCNMYFIT